MVVVEGEVGSNSKKTARLIAPMPPPTALLYQSVDHNRKQVLEMLDAAGSKNQGQATSRKRLLLYTCFFCTQQPGSSTLRPTMHGVCGKRVLTGLALDTPLFI